MPLRDRNAVRVNVVLDRARDRKLDQLAEQSQRSRSAVVRDAIDRLFAPIPDADLGSGTHQTK